jgi:hypothetical protein
MLGAKVGVVVGQIDNCRFSADATFHNGRPGSGSAGNDRTDFYDIVIEQQRIARNQGAVRDDQHRLTVHIEFGDKGVHTNGTVYRDFAARVA